MEIDSDNRISVVVWESPPVDKRDQYDWSSIAEQLHANPMKWAKIFDEGRTSVVNAIRQGAIPTVHPDLGYQVKTANNVRSPIRMCTLYLRYNPDLERERKDQNGG